MFQSLPLSLQSPLLGVRAHVLNLNFWHHPLQLLLLGPERELIGLSRGHSCRRPLELAGYPLLKFGLTRISVV
jgi:hypothetical protein